MSNYIEYFNHTMLVEHNLMGGTGTRTVCGEVVSEMLPARPKDIKRAARGRKTILTACLECATGKTYD